MSRELDNTVVAVTTISPQRHGQGADEVFMLECGQIGILRDGRGGGGEGRGEDGPEGGVEGGDHFIVLVVLVECGWRFKMCRYAQAKNRNARP